MQLNFNLHMFASLQKFFTCMMYVCEIPYIYCLIMKIVRITFAKTEQDICQLFYSFAELP